MSEALRGYLQALLRIARWRVALVLALMLAAGALEGASLLLLMALLQLIGLDVRQGAGGVTHAAAAAFAALGLRPTLGLVLAIFAAVAVGGAWLQRAQGLATAAVKQGLLARLRQDLYRSLSAATWPHVARRRSTDFVHGLTTETERVGDGTESLLVLAFDAMLGLAYVGLALQLSPALTAVVLGCGAALVLLLRHKTSEAAAVGEALTRASRDYQAAAGEHLAGLKAARSHGLAGRHEELFAHLSGELARVHLAASRVWADSRAWYEVGAALSLAALLYGATRVLSMPPGQALLLLYLFTRLMPRFASAMHSVQYVSHMLPAFATLQSLQTSCDAAREQVPAGREPVRLSKELRLAGVAYTYPDATIPALRGLDLVVPAGSFTALVGPSGSGKTTVADLIMGLLIPDRGQVLVDGTPLTPERLPAWREQIGYVSQDTFLFADTVRANLRWACPDATDEQLWQSLRQAAAAEFVAELPRGLDTELGDRGQRLSGGERQRLALARALLRRPALLILDEATSALDSDNERRIFEVIMGLRGAMTVLAITHRLAAVRGADAIHVLVRGQLVESGPWDELLDREGGVLRRLSGDPGGGPGNP